MTDTKKPKAVIYARVSSKRQKTEFHGLESQETRCSEYATIKGYEILKVFKDDITGARGKRPAMDEMLSLLRVHRKSEPLVVIIDDVSRLARHVRVHFDLRAAIAALLAERR